MATIAVWFVLIASGFAARRRALIGERFDRLATALLMDILFPILCFRSTASQIRPEDLGTVARLMALGAGGVVLSLATALPLLPAGRLAPRERGTFLNIATFTNYGYIPVPIVASLMGDSGIARLMIHNVPITCLYWSLGAALLEIGSGIRAASGGGVPPSIASHIADGLRRALNFPLAAVAIGIAVGATGSYRWIPDLATRILDALGQPILPLAMVLTGSLLGAQRYPRALWRAPVTYILPFQRLILAPAAAALILAFLPIPAPERAIALLVICMPSPASSPIIARVFGGDAVLAAWGPMVTTLFAAGTVPLWILAIFGGSHGPS